MGFFDTLKRIYTTPPGPSRNDVFPMNVDQMGNVISAGPPSIPTASPNVERKPPVEPPSVTTPAVSSMDRPIVRQGGKENVLNNYRSSTYNFTLAALSSKDVNDPAVYRNSALNFVILKSGGKGTTGISTDVVGIEKKIGEDAIREGGQGIVKTDITELNFDGRKLVDGFNYESPGRFDMFIENVEIETLMSFTPESGLTLPTSIKFDIIEPYSINGFIEALHVSAVAAGYPSYLQASFLLKLEFVGYPDNELVTISKPKKIPNSERYFVFGFTGIEVSIDENGTKYRCTAVPFNERAFGQPNTLKRPISMAGDTVKSILQNLIDGINKQVKESDNASKKTPATMFDEYAIVFPTWDEKTGFDFSKNDNDISVKTVNALSTGNNIFTFPPIPDEKNAKKPANFSYNPTTPVVQFSEGAVIHECISALIRDSNYVKDLLKTIGTNKNNPDNFGMVTYFSVQLQVQNKSEINLSTKKPYQKYIYVVSPYKIHYSVIPNYASERITRQLELLSTRQYNYIYTGKNVDVIDFKLNFNTLFFEAVPTAMGNNDSPGARDAAGKGNTGKIIDTNRSLRELAKNSLGDPGKKTDATATQVVPNAGGRASQINDDPYSIMSINMHEAIVNSNSSMISGELGILGDPFFLSTGGIGNYNPKPSAVGVVGEGEAANLYGDVLITVNFRNPIDINPLSNNGLLQFESKRVPFSGVYRVLKAQNNFKAGVFSQRLEIIRINGQVLEDEKTVTNPASAQQTVSDPLEVVVPSTTLETPRGVQIISDSQTAQANLLAALPAVPSIQSLTGNLTNVVDGVGVKITSLLSTVNGTVSNGLATLQAASTNVMSVTDKFGSVSSMLNTGLSTIQTAASNIPSAANISSTLNNGLSTIQTAASTVPSVADKFGSLSSPLTKLIANNTEST